MRYDDREGVTMADSLADRLNRRSEEQRRLERSQQEATEFQNRINAFISDNARVEYDRMTVSLKQQIDGVNAKLHNLPAFQLGSAMVQQGNCVASWHFDKPIANAPNNRLTIGIGTHPNAIYFMTRRQSQSGSTSAQRRPTGWMGLSGLEPQENLRVRL
jgi:hypothetical protein